MKCVSFFILCVVSVNCRFTDKIADQKDEISNLITDNIHPIEKVVAKSVTTEKTLVKPIEQTTTNDNLINITFNNDTVREGPFEANRPCVTTKDLIDNLVNADFNTSGLILNICTPKEPKERVDNGTALLLSPYLKEGKAKEARVASKVDPSLFLGIKSYSGFFTVNETYNSNIFFWYFPVLNKPVEESPWLIWLQGGPGASSMTGLFDEIGPFTYVNKSLKLNPYTWLQNHSLVFIDNPVGTGYSFTDHNDGYVTDMATYGSHLYSTLIQLLQVYPELKTAPLYISGESYAGKYVPAMAMEIHKRTNENSLQEHGINFQGIIIGNGYVDPEMISRVAWPFYYFGLLDKEQLEIVKPLMNAFHDDIKANRSIEAKRKWNSLVTVSLFLSHQKHGYNFLIDDLQLGRYISFLKTSEVKRAIHVGDIHFGFVNLTVNTKLAPDFLSSTKPIIETLLEHYRVLVYCGQLDLMLPCIFTSENYRTWKWNATDEFLNAVRFPYIFNNQLSGYHKTGGGLTEVMIRGAGHMVPLDKPAPSQNFIARWTHRRNISNRFGDLDGSFLQSYINQIITDTHINNSTTYL